MLISIDSFPGINPTRLSISKYGLGLIISILYANDIGIVHFNEIFYIIHIKKYYLFSYQIYIYIYIYIYYTSKNTYLCYRFT
jgi:hypothetical protein